MNALHIECMYCGNAWSQKMAELSNGVSCPKCGETSLLRQKKSPETGSNPFGYPAEEKEREEPNTPSPPISPEPPPTNKDDKAQEDEGQANRDAEPVPEDEDPFVGWPGSPPQYYF